MEGCLPRKGRKAGPRPGLWFDGLCVRLKGIGSSCSRATLWQPETWELWAGAPGPLPGPRIYRRLSTRESKPGVGHMTQLCCLTRLPPCLCLGRPRARHP